MVIEHRAEPRELLSLPLKLGDGSAAVTRDISASGMYIEIPGEAPLEGPVVFEMQLVEARMKFTAEGVIVRIDHMPGTTGVAVRLVARKLEPLP
jgi:hypothetical protein